jgi:predicted SnoaL-like aldol condensation-catalyzing enzyme
MKKIALCICQRIGYLFLLLLTPFPAQSDELFSSAQQRKEIILNFYKKLGEKELGARLQSLDNLAQSYKDHDPFLEGDKESLAELIKKNPIDTRVKNVFSDGDYVIAHVHYVLYPEIAGQSGMDIFRFENDRIAERWTVLQPIPLKSLNKNGIF